jgi:hypothetical protein
MTCDFRFSRNVENYDLLIYVASDPKQELKLGTVLLTARAIENMSYAICNRDRRGQKKRMLYVSIRK